MADDDSHEMCVDGEIESQAREIPPVPQFDQSEQEVSSESEPKDKKRKGKAKGNGKGEAFTSDV